jgi:ribosome maturation factor RimP
MDNEKIIRELVEEKLAEIGGFIVDINIHPNAKIEVLIDKDPVLNIRDCVQVSRYVEHSLEESGNDLLTTHSLDVASPGLDQPLKQLQQYYKNIGRTLLVQMKEGPEITGVLKSATEAEITLEAQVKQKGKKAAVIEMHTIPFSTIKETKIVISFK